MAHLAPDHGRNEHNVQGLGSVADELKRESDRLRQLAEELTAREEAQAEMQANYPYFKQAIYAVLREQFERELAPLPDNDLEALAAAEGAQPLETFIGELERLAAGPWCTVEGPPFVGRIFNPSAQAGRIENPSYERQAGRWILP